MKGDGTFESSTREREKGSKASVLPSKQKLTNPIHESFDGLQGGEVDETVFDNPASDPATDVSPRSPRSKTITPRAAYRGVVTSATDIVEKVPGGAMLGKGFKASLKMMDEMFASTNDPLQPEEMLDILETFKAIDFDHSGSLDVDEVSLALRVLGADVDNDNLRQQMDQAKQDAADEVKRRGIAGALAGGLVDALEALTVTHIESTPAQQIMDGVSLDKIRADEKYDSENPDVLNFVEFAHLMASTTFVEQYFPDGWMTGALEMRMLRTGFGIADLDGNGTMNFDEFKTAGTVMNEGILLNIELQQVWKILNPDNKDNISYVEYLEGMVNVRQSERWGKKFSLAKPDMLMGIVFDTPVSAMEEQRILSGIPAPERFGLSVMKKFQGDEMGEDAKRELFERREKGTIHIVTAEHSRSLRHLHWWSVFVGLMIGTITCSFLSVFEAWFVGYMGCDGLTQTELECRDGNFSVSCEPAGLTDQASHEEHSWEYPVGHQLEGLGVCNGLCQTYVSLYPSADETSKECTHFCMDGTAIDGMKERECETSDAAVFWTLLIIAIGIQATFEIGLLYYYAIKYAVSVSESLQMRLHPLNRDRAFVGTSLVKSALELPNPSTAILGVDPLKDQGAMGPCAQACFLLIYKAKIGMTSVILKLILRRFLTRGSARTVLPFMAIPATAIWDAFFAHLSISEAKLRGVGFATAIEVFNKIADAQLAEEEDKDDYTPQNDFSINLVRSIGAIITKNGSFYPTKEALLRHAVTHVQLLQGAKDNLAGEDEEKDTLQLDSLDLLREQMPSLPTEQQSCCLQVMCLAVALNGHVSSKEKACLEELIEAASDEVASNDALCVDRLRLVCQRFRSTLTLTVEDVAGCVRPANDDTFSLSCCFYFKEFTQMFTKCITC